MMDVEQQYEWISAPDVLLALLNELSAITDYHTLRDGLPRCLATLLKCHSVLLYQRVSDDLHFASGSFNEKPGWSSSLLAVAHVNPVSLESDVAEACAWRERHAIVLPAFRPNRVVLPLIYRHRGIGVLVVIRGHDEEKPEYPDYWADEEVPVLEAVAGVVALLLENTRLLEQGRERNHELSLLNNIGSQINFSMYELSRMRRVVVQRAKEISSADLCELVESSTVADTGEWIPLAFRERLLQHFLQQRSLVPFVIERPGERGNMVADDYLALLPTSIKTFFAVPLLSGHTIGRRGSSLLRGSLGTALELRQEPQVLGMIVGGYHRPWKLRREELVLLKTLAGQVSAALENMHLMAEVIEARNEASKLLRQVLDDQRLKEIILESIPSGLITTDRAGQIVTFNRAAQAILGYHPREVLGQPLHKFIDLHPGQSHNRSPRNLSPLTPSQEEFYTVLPVSEVKSGTVVVVDRRGHEVVLDVDVLPLCDESGAQVGTLATFTDITSVHRMEEEKRRLDRLASLGEMAANVAHEVRNPLASIKTSMQMLRDDLVSGELPSAQTALTNSGVQTDWAQESISVVLKEVERLDTIVGDLLLFAKPRQLHRIKCSLVELSDRVLQFIQPQCAEASVVIHRMYEDVPLLMIDMSQIEQVLLNLYMNAVQAMPDGGILTISCHVISADIATCGIEDVEAVQSQENSSLSAQLSRRMNKAALFAQQWLEISVSDTGVGIAPDQRDRIFQPFFTTKAHGIGLGLAITRRLVEDHGGYIRVESHLGYGAVISVRLPLLTDEVTEHHDEGENL